MLVPRPGGAGGTFRTHYAIERPALSTPEVRAPKESGGHGDGTGGRACVRPRVMVRLQRGRMWLVAVRSRQLEGLPASLGHEAGR